MTYIILIVNMFSFFSSAATSAGFVGKAGKFMLGMGVTTTMGAVGGAVCAGTWEFRRQLTLFLRKYDEREGNCNELRRILNKIKREIETKEVKHDSLYTQLKARS